MIREAFGIARFVLGHPVGRRRPIRCAWDTLAWQLGAGSEPRAVRFVGDARLWARRGETGVTGNIYVGLHEFSEMAFVLHFLREGDLFGDIGANAGSYTVLAGRVAGARVVAVEPVPETAARLAANVDLNDIAKRVRIERTAVSDHEGIIAFTADADTVNRVVTTEDTHRRSIDVPCTTLDRLFAEERPILLKIDVEGHEVSVLEGARGLLASGVVPALVVEMADPSGRGWSLLADLGYEAFERRLTVPRAGPNGRAGNVLWIRDRALVEERVCTAPPVRVKGLRI